MHLHCHGDGSLRVGLCCYITVPPPFLQSKVILLALLQSLLCRATLSLRNQSVSTFSSNPWGVPSSQVLSRECVCVYWAYGSFMLLCMIFSHGSNAFCFVFSRYSDRSCLWKQVNSRNAFEQVCFHNKGVIHTRALTYLISLSFVSTVSIFSLSYTRSK